MKRLAFALLFSASASYACAQSTVTITGAVTPGDCTEFASVTVLKDAGVVCGVTAGVSSIVNSDGTLTISPTTGSAVASIALGHANTWSAVQKYVNGDFALLGSSTGYTLLESGLSSTGNNTLTLPTTGADTLAAVGTAQTWTAAQTFTNGDLLLKGSSSGAITLEAPAAASSYVVTFPAATDTVATLGAANAFSGNNSFSGVTTWTGSLKVPVRTASSTTDNLSATTDYFVCADNSGGAATENLPASPGSGLTFLIKDCSGSAATHSITITPNAGNVDGASTFVMNTNYESVAVTYSGAQWSIN